MINSFITLFRTDFKIILFWLSKRPISKIIVIIGFLLLFILIDRIIYSSTFIIFSFFKSTGVFGRLTVLYILHTSIIMLIWFAIVSIMLTTISRFLRINSIISFLITLPISPTIIVSWIFFKTFIMNIILLFIFIMPILIGYANVFFEKISFSFLSIIFIVISIISFFTTSIGTILGYIIVLLFKTSVKKSLMIYGIFLLISGITIIKLIYPSNIKLFDYTKGLPEFQKIFHSLPLGYKLNPTYWLIDSIVSGLDMRIFILLFFVAILTIFTIKMISNRFIIVFQRLQEYRIVNNSNKENRIKILISLQELFKITNYPIFLKDIISILRLSSEIGFAIFIASLTIVFFILNFVISNKVSESSLFHEQIILFFFSSFMFFATAYLLRFSFPLIAREGGSAWFIFTQPISKNKILKEKLILSLIISIPFFILNLFIWEFYKFIENNIFFIILTSITLLSIVFSTIIIGAISPNFDENKDAERISTSGPGLLSLALNIIIVLINGYVLHLFINNQQLFLISFLSIFFGNAIIVLFIYFIFSKNNNYQF